MNLCLDCHADVSAELKMTSSHAPAQQDCLTCHRGHGDMRAKLIADRTNHLCFGCHKEMAQVDTLKSVHAPFTDGSCLDCHRPHGSKFAGLAKNNLLDLCGDCHTDVSSWLASGNVHVPIKTGRCADCHNPHASANAGLLKQASADLCQTCHATMTAQQGDRIVHQPFAERQCDLCHVPHASANKGLLAKKEKDVCADCHDVMPADTSGLASIHRPVADGACTGCHQPHLAALPGLWPTGRLLSAMIAAFLRQLNMRMRFWAVGDDRSRAFMGVGAFNLVRRSAFERTEGLEWLRMEVADDAGLGLMMKKSGARCRMCNARNWLGLHWYRTIGDMVRGMEKGYAPIADCRLWRAGVSIVLMLAVELAPVLALAGGAGWLAGGGGARAWVLLAGGSAMLACAIAGSLAVRKWTQVPASALPLWPIATLIVAAGFARSAVLGFLRGGVRWRDTFYTCDQLRRGRRVKI